MHVLVCCDGTWNSPESQTNVWKFCDFVAKGGNAVPTKLDAEERHFAADNLKIFYQTGVGTKKHERVRGGAFGKGLSRKLVRAYDYIVRNYEPGDKLYLIGFSRGAYTVRSLCGLIQEHGLPEAQTPAKTIYRLVNAYIDPKHQTDAPEVSNVRKVPIRFLGVWDTVGKLGIPVPALFNINNIFNLRPFHDTGLSPIVEHACHALAIDERRGAFPPVVWSRMPGLVDPSVTETSEPVPQRMLQVWFVGSHGDVGGGWNEQGGEGSDVELSDITLHWMLKRAERAGLPLPVDWERLRSWGNALGVRHNSTVGIWRLVEGGAGDVISKAVTGTWFDWFFRFLRLFQIKPYIRPLTGEINADVPHHYSVPAGIQIHRSVLERYANCEMPKRIRQAVEAGVDVFDEPETVASEPEVRIDGTNVYHMVDRSRGGLAVKQTEGQAVAKLELGQNCDVTLLDASSNEMPRKARVAWAEDNKAGLAWIKKAMS